MNHSNISNDNFDKLIQQLESHDGLERQKARQVLVNLGRFSTSALLEELKSSNPHARWEAAKALAEIADPSSAQALVMALEDDDISVRWTAMEGLIALDRAGLKPLLEALTYRFNSVWLREGARHVLHQLLIRGRLKDQERRVYKALGDMAAEMEVPWVAESALEDLTYSRAN